MSLAVVTSVARCCSASSSRRRASPSLEPLVVAEGERSRQPRRRAREHGEEALRRADAGPGDDALAFEPAASSAGARVAAQHRAGEAVPQPLGDGGRRRSPRVDDDGIGELELEVERRPQRAGRDHQAVADAARRRRPRRSSGPWRACGFCRPSSMTMTVHGIAARSRWRGRRRWRSRATSVGAARASSSASSPTSRAASLLAVTQ